MDFHSMKRKQLQALCKKHNIPANLKNVEMADRLAALLKIDDEKPKEQLVKPCLKNLEDLIVIDDELSEGKEHKKVRFSPQDETFLFEKTNPRAVRATRRHSMAIGEDQVSKKGRISALEDVKEKGVENAADEQTGKLGAKKTRGVGKRKLSSMKQVEDLQTDPLEKTKPRATRIATRRRNSMAVGEGRIRNERTRSVLEVVKEKDGENAADEKTKKVGVKQRRCVGKRNLSSIEHVKDLQTVPLENFNDLVDNSDVEDCVDSVSEAVDIQNTLCNGSSVVEDDQGKSQSPLQTKSPSPLLDKCNSKKDVEGSCEESYLIKEPETVTPSPMVVECDPSRGEGSLMEGTELESLSNEEDTYNLESEPLKKCIISDFSNLEDQMSIDGMADLNSQPNINTEFESSMQKSGDTTVNKCIDHAGKNMGYDQDAEEVTNDSAVISIEPEGRDMVDDVSDVQMNENHEDAVVANQNLEKAGYDQDVKGVTPTAIGNVDDECTAGTDGTCISYGTEERNGIAAANDSILSSNVPEGTINEEMTMIDVSDAEMADNHGAHNGDTIEYSSEPNMVDDVSDLQMNENHEDAVLSDQHLEKGMHEADETNRSTMDDESPKRTVTERSSKKAVEEGSNSKLNSDEESYGIDTLFQLGYVKDAEEMVEVSNVELDKKISPHKAMSNPRSCTNGRKTELGLQGTHHLQHETAVASSMMVEFEPHNGDVFYNKISEMEDQFAGTISVNDQAISAIGHEEEKHGVDVQFQEDKGKNMGCDQDAEVVSPTTSIVEKLKKSEDIDNSNSAKSECSAECEINHKDELEKTNSPASNEGTNGFTHASGVPLIDSHEQNAGDTLDVSDVQPKYSSEINHVQVLEETNDNAVISIEPESRDMVDDVSDVQMNENHEDATAGDTSDVSDVQPKYSSEINHVQVLEETNDNAVISIEPESRDMVDDVSDVQMNENHEDATVANQNLEKAGYDQDLDIACTAGTVGTCITDRTEYAAEPVVNDKQGLEGVPDSEPINEETTMIDVSDAEIGDNQVLEETNDSVVISIELEGRDMVDDVSDVQMNDNNEDAVLADQHLEKAGIQEADETNVSATHKPGVEVASNSKLNSDEESYGIDTLFQLGYETVVPSSMIVESEPHNEDVFMNKNSEMEDQFAGTKRSSSVSNVLPDDVIMTDVNGTIEVVPPTTSIVENLKISEGVTSEYPAECEINHKHELENKTVQLIDNHEQKGNASDEESFGLASLFQSDYAEDKSGLVDEKGQGVNLLEVSDVELDNDHEKEALAGEDMEVYEENGLINVELQGGNSFEVSDVELDNNHQNEPLAGKYMEVYEENGIASLFQSEYAEDKSGLADEKGQGGNSFEVSDVELYNNHEKEALDEENGFINDELQGGNSFEVSDVLLDNSSQSEPLAGEDMEVYEENGIASLFQPEYAEDENGLNDEELQGGENMEVDEEKDAGKTCRETCEVRERLGDVCHAELIMKSSVDEETISDKNGNYIETRATIKMIGSSPEPEENFIGLDAGETCGDSVRLGNVGHPIDSEEFRCNSQNKLAVDLQGSEENLNIQGSVNEEKNSDENGTCIESIAKPEEDLIGLVAFERFIEQTGQQKENENFAITYEAEKSDGENFDLKDSVHPELSMTEINDQFKSGNEDAEVVPPTTSTVENLKVSEGIDYKHEHEIKTNSPASDEESYGIESLFQSEYAEDESGNSVEVSDADLDNSHEKEALAGENMEVYEENSLIKNELQGSNLFEVSDVELHNNRENEALAGENMDVDEEKDEEKISDENELMDAEGELIGLAAFERFAEQTEEQNGNELEKSDGENFELKPDLEESAHPELSITEIDDQCKSGNVKGVCMDDETLPLKDEAANDKGTCKVMKQKKRSIMIHGTPVRPINTSNMKENSQAHLKRELSMGDATAFRPLAKRKALGELHRK